MCVDALGAHLLEEGLVFRVLVRVPRVYGRRRVGVDAAASGVALENFVYAPTYIRIRLVYVVGYVDRYMHRWHICLRRGLHFTFWFEARESTVVDAYRGTSLTRNRPSP